ncbi:uncharacterized protein SETTUDRAFT_161688 [Exserohilum turcica Et28A]|uniref:Uncharacterized protein n=1 Tax=Exserohilum turcicum (strain 28A) TaxID=671987 RepID=R0KBZ5_EXST2|nr:uncharacterized protein SETTUDRAFT_161688 [Exserohilum turcica Et28A]EOA85752.1 hypothetical protein SETTUDRAFT_161688 [Exserohilum turcica Et28A]
MTVFCSIDFNQLSCENTDPGSPKRNYPPSSSGTTRVSQRTPYSSEYGSFPVAFQSLPGTNQMVEVIDLTQDSPPAQPAPKKSKRNTNGSVEEKRGTTFRRSATQSYLTVKERALTQRLTVLSRERCGSDDTPEEKVIIAGTTGNVYTVLVDREPSCDCPHAKKGNQCKHIVYVMLRVLRAREEIAYQLALLSSELREVFQNAPPIPGVGTNGKDGTQKQGEDGNRKPIEGECPICYDDLDNKENIDYCKASCGNNVHRSCMQNWKAASKGKTTCPYCRATWQEDTNLPGKLGDINTKGLARNEDGYVNIAPQLGLSGERDYSTYYSYWARSRSGYGGRRGDYY